jgi:hypothetical protein
MLFGRASVSKERQQSVKQKPWINRTQRSELPKNTQTDRHTYRPNKSCHNHETSKSLVQDFPSVVLQSFRQVRSTILIRNTVSISLTGPHSEPVHISTLPSHLWARLVHMGLFNQNWRDVQVCYACYTIYQPRFNLDQKSNINFLHMQMKPNLKDWSSF